MLMLQTSVIGWVPGSHVSVFPWLSSDFLENYGILTFNMSQLLCSRSVFMLCMFSSEISLEATCLFLKRKSFEGLF